MRLHLLLPLLLPLLLLATSVSALEIPAGTNAPLHAAFQRGLVTWLSQRMEAPLRAALPPAGQARVGDIIALIADPSARPSAELLRSVRELRAGRMDLETVAGIAYGLVEDRALSPGKAGPWCSCAKEQRAWRRIIACRSFVSSPR